MLAAVGPGIAAIVLAAGVLVPILGLRLLGGGVSPAAGPPGATGSVTGPTGPEPTGPLVTGPWPVGTDHDGGVVYLPPTFAGGQEWSTWSSEPAPPDDATTAWASTVPFAEEMAGFAIPFRTIENLGSDEVVVTALTVTSTFDPSLGPFPYDLSGLRLSDAVVRGRGPEEPPGDDAVLELDLAPVLVRVYFGVPAPSAELVATAQRELDTLQLPPTCPAPAEGPYGATLGVDHGSPGDAVTISGRMPFQREDGSYDTSGDTRMVGWWNAAPEDWPYLASFSTASPAPAIDGSPLLRLGEDGGDVCTFSFGFAVPDVPPGEYPIVLLQEGGGGATIEAALEFHVDPAG